MSLARELAWKNVWRKPVRTTLLVAPLTACLATGTLVASARIVALDTTTWVICAALFAAAILGITHVLVVSVHERILEFGVMRAMGISRKRLAMMIVFESVLLTFTSTLIAGLIAMLGGVVLALDSDFSHLVHGFGFSGTSLYIGSLVHGPHLAALVAIGVVTSSLASIAPALAAARIDPVEILRVRG